jgi:hypothetical protein
MQYRGDLRHKMHARWTCYVATLPDVCAVSHLTYNIPDRNSGAAAASHRCKVCGAAAAPHCCKICGAAAALIRRVCGAEGPPRLLT